MKRRTALLVLGTAVLLIMAAVPSFAQRTYSLCVESDYDGAFVASGGAVDSGLISETGTRIDKILGWSFSDDGALLMLEVEVTLTFDDGSGTLVVLLLGSVNLDSRHTMGHWEVIGGTDRYAGISGSGGMHGYSQYPVWGWEVWNGVLK